MNATTFSPQEVLKQLEWRYATKEFDSSKKIPEDVWQVLEQSLVLSPSSFGLQPWKFFVIRNREIRHQLLEHSWGQKQVVEASHLVVLAIKKDVTIEYVDSYLQRMSELRNVPLENLQKLGDMVKGFVKQPADKVDKDAWSNKQVYIALGFFMFAAAMLEIDTCPMEGFISDKYDEILGLAEKGYHSVAVCPAGYRASSDKYATMAKVRFKTEEVVEYID